tara:strand:- start:3157 stop:3309 length:153 start_codon:yes stop_codon:yes gene_type:complete
MALVRKEGVTYEVADKPATPKPAEKKAASSGSSKKPSEKKAAPSADKKSK